MALSAIVDRREGITGKIQTIAGGKWASQAGNSVIGGFWVLVQDLCHQEGIWSGTIGRCKSYFLDDSYSIVFSSFAKSCSYFFFFFLNITHWCPWWAIFSDLYHIWDLLLPQHLWPAIKDLILFPFKCKGVKKQNGQSTGDYSVRSCRGDLGAGHLVSPFARWHHLWIL